MKTKHGLFIWHTPSPRSKEFIEFLAMADTYYPSDWKLRIILDNHSSHISKETMIWLKGKPNRFEFIYTPKHGSRLNLIEIFFSKMTSAFLRSLRVTSKTNLKQRIEKYLDEVNAALVVFKWKYKLDEGCTSFALRRGEQGINRL